MLSLANRTRTEGAMPQAKSTDRLAIWTPVLVHGASNVALPRTLVFLPNRVGLPRSRVDRDRPRDRPVDIERREGHAERQVFHYLCDRPVDTQRREGHAER